jgi:hypothetical protein
VFGSIEESPANVQALRQDTRANIAMMFGIVTVPLIVATGAAIDYSRAYEQRMVVQDALDAAALAANRLIGFATEEEIFQEALRFFTANTDGRLDSTVTLSMVLDGGSVELTTQLPVPTVFLGIIGIEIIDFDLRSLSLAGAATYEVVMVLDNSTSMQGSKIDALKEAATDLVNSLFELSLSNPAPDPVRIGMVPFAASVNVGANNATATWMDQNGIAPYAGLNHDYDATPTTAFTNRFALFDMMSNIEWGGCVEARAYPYMVDDTTPTTAVPATLFQPMFAPDEPDPWGVNDYLDDEGGTCEAAAATAGTPACPPGRSRNWCRNNGYNPPGEPATPPTPAGLDYCGGNELCEQERVYNGIVATAFNGFGEGPNHHCTATAITPLTNSQATLLASINAMFAPSSPTGYTNIEEGVMWGWRVLSDNAPFTGARPYGEVGNHKVLIVMTDGANTYVTRSNMNRSQYMAFNYIIHGYLGTTSSTNSVVVDAMNDRTLEACANIPQQITVYTIAFELDDADAEQILLDCASDPTKAFDAGNSEELVAVFQLIAQDIATLRIAE